MDETTDERELVERLRESAQQPKTREERFAQRVSFVYGNQPRGMTFTREEIETRLRQELD